MFRHFQILLLIFLVSIPTLLLNGCSGNDEPIITEPGVFTTTAGSATIEGELFLPEGMGPFPLMIIVPGSGNEPRQDLEQFAQILNPNGYAMYIYDKRGVGGSTGSYPVETPATQTEFLSARAEDVLGIIELLKTHSKLAPGKIGVMGSSQGAWVNSIVHSRSTDLAYIVMASGGVASTGLEGFYCSLTDNPAVTIEEAVNQLDNFDGEPGFDPLSLINSMAIPVLWIYGKEDRSHPALYDIQVLEELNKSNFTLQVYENTDHELLDLTTRQPPSDLYSNLGAWLVINN